MLRLFVDGSLNAVKLRIDGSSVIKAILREPRFPDTHGDYIYYKLRRITYWIINAQILSYNPNKQFEYKNIILVFKNTRIFWLSEIATDIYKTGSEAIKSIYRFYSGWLHGSSHENSFDLEGILFVTR